MGLYFPRLIDLIHSADSKVSIRKLEKASCRSPRRSKGMKLQTAGKADATVVPYGMDWSSLRSKDSVGLLKTAESETQHGVASTYIWTSLVFQILICMLCFRQQIAM